MWNPLLIWSLKAGVVLSLLYGSYYFLFRNNTQFQLKRFILLLLMVAAVGLPLLKVHIERNTIPIVQVFQELDNQYFEPVAALTTSELTSTKLDAEQASAIPISQVLWYVYLAGIAVSLLIFLGELAKLTYWRTTGTAMTSLGKNVISHSNVKYPFSFWKWVFIPQSVDYSASEWEVIYEHETLHLNERHTVDMLFTALAQCLLWYHPAVYLFQKGMKSNHEALADSAVLKSTNFGRYSEVLLALSLRTNTVTLGHSFALISSLSKRLKVMKLKKTTKRNTYASIISFAVLALVIASQTVSYGQDKASASSSDFGTAVEINVGKGYSTIPIFEKNMNQMEGQLFIQYGRIGIPFILTEKYQEKVAKIRQTYYQDNGEEDRTFWLELDSNKDSYYSSQLKPEGMLGAQMEFLVELSTDELMEFYEETVAWLKSNDIPNLDAKSKSADLKIISQNDFLEHKYLSIRSHGKSNYEREYDMNDVFSSKQVDEKAEPIGGINQFLNNVTLKTVRGKDLEISELPKTIEFEFVVNNQGHVTQVELLSKVKGNEETQKRVYKLMRQLNDNIQSVSRIHRWKPALKDNEFVSSKYKIEIPKSLL